MYLKIPWEQAKSIILITGYKITKRVKKCLDMVAKITKACDCPPFYSCNKDLFIYLKERTREHVSRHEWGKGGTGSQRDKETVH